MVEKEKKILETFGRVVPTLSDTQKEVLLAYGEGMAFKTQSQQEKKNPPDGRQKGA